MKAFILSKLLIATCLLSLTHADMTFGEDPGAVYPMALLPFKERGKNTKDLDNMVTDLLFAELVSKPELFLVEREDIESAFKELELNLSGVVAPGEATKVGHLTGARILVTGSVLDVNGKLYLIAKVMGTETTRVKGMSVKGKRGDDLDVLIANLGDAIAKTILNNADSLIAKSVSRDDRIKSLAEKLGGAKRPIVLVDVEERHIGSVTFDPAAETELMLYCTETDFEVLDPDAANRTPQIRLVGEGLTEFATRHGNLVSVKARLEVKAIEESTGKVIAIDRHTTVHVDLTEQLAGKAALQEASATIAERLLPKLVERFNRQDDKKNGPASKSN